ncbi:restriction endonuclease subunit S [Streptomyces sp. NPDC057689]|uniref:restriction endonuclease subunit S n=1 Tax=Streptomyces sp. NPDC057689 TaxID=3346213 RepID=UPI0036A43E12
MELPAGWVWARLGDLLREPLRNGHSARSTKEAGGVRTLSLSAVTKDDFSDSNTKITVADPDRVSDLWLEAGDILIQRSNTPELVGTSAIYRGPDGWAIFPDLLIRVRLDLRVDSQYVALFLRSPRARSHFKSRAKGLAGSMPKIDQAAISGLGIPLPPLAEQHRIVEALEGHLSRLDAAVATAQNARKRLVNLRKSVLLDLVPGRVPDSWTATTVEQAGTVELGRARHPDWHHGPEMRPYLRVANVFEDRIDTSDVMEMDFSGIFEKYRLHSGDVLLNEGQSPHLVGRPALYRGTPPNVAFTNSLLRFKTNPNVMPEWALMVFRRHLHARRFMREVRITTNIAHLSSKRLKAIEFPIPPMDVQKELVVRCDEVLSGIDVMDREATRALARAQNLRRAILTRAFTGALVPQDPTDEPAAALLARIQADRAAQPKAKRVRRAPAVPRKPKAPAAPAPAPAPSPTPAPTHAVQQEFDL